MASSSDSNKPSSTFFNVLSRLSEIQRISSFSDWKALFNETKVDNSLIAPLLSETYNIIVV